jgi:uncharacterized protein
MTNPNVDLLSRAYGAFAIGDIPTVLSALADDITWHVPGDNPLSGVYKGHDAVLDFFGRCAELSSGTLRVDAGEIVAEGERVFVLSTVSAERKGRFWSSPEVHMWRVVDGLATDFREFQGGQTDEDAFWNS